MAARHDELADRPDESGASLWPPGKHPPMCIETLHDTPAEAAARERSRASARRALADPAYRAFISAAEAELDARPPSPPISREQFLASYGAALGLR